MRLQKLTLIILSLVGLALASCERKYDAPLLTEPTVKVGEEGMLTIAEYKEKYKDVSSEGKLIEENFAIRAVVVGNDISGNIYKQIYVQDATGGISIGIDQNNISNDYKVGQEVFIKLQGLAATSFAGQVQIGMVKTSSNRIPYEVAKQHILKDKWPSIEKAKPTVTTIGQINDAMVGTLIQLENVYFTLGGEKTFGDQAFNNVNRDLKDTKGNKIYVRNSKYATFSNDVMPKGNGTVVAVLSKFNKDYQLSIRSIDDVFGFTGKDPITDGNTPEEPSKPDTPAPSVGSVIYSEDFAQNLGKMTAKSVLGDQSWRVNTQYKNANISGFFGGKSNANEDWLVSPVLDLSKATSASISFSHAINKGNVANMKTEQTLWVSTNYTGDVKSATWTQVTIPTYPSGTDWTYVPSGNINLPASVLGQAKVVFAFKYICTDASSANWQIRDLKVTSAGGKLAEGSTPTPTPEPQPQPQPQPEPQPEPQPAPAGLLFPGSDFNDWAAFESSLNKYKVQNGEKSANGRSGNALLINKSTDKNAYVFTAEAPKNGKKSGNAIVFYIKGTSNKSISMNVYLSTGTNSYVAYNLDAVGGEGHTVTPADGDIVLQPMTGQYANSYAKGSIDTKGQWIKVTLNIKGQALATSGNFFALKIAKQSTNNLLIDDITIE